jgi:hypothetical protein
MKANDAAFYHLKPLRGTAKRRKKSSRDGDSLINIYRTDACETFEAQQLSYDSCCQGHGAIIFVSSDTDAADH